MLSLLKIYLSICVLFFVLIPVSFAWNATGHFLIALLAYEQLTPTTREQVDRLLNDDFLNASVWPDDVRAKGNTRMNTWHYINFYFNDQGDLLDKPQQAENVIWAIDNSQSVLMDPSASQAEKSIALKGLLHWVADLHQPLHTSSRVTSAHPQGDKGGTLFLLTKNARYKNLHQFWDNGGGLLPYLKRPLNEQDKKWLTKTAAAWQAQMSREADETTPAQWAAQSFLLAQTQVYVGITENTLPNKAYTASVQQLTRQQIILASSRLARYLEALF